jgi:hypothetical protein
MDYIRNLSMNYGRNPQGRIPMGNGELSWWDGRACRSIVATLLAGCLAGCAHQATRSTEPPANQGDASWHAVEQPDTVHYQLALGEVSSGATALRRVTPVYPAAQLQVCPPTVDVTARLIVDTRGQVTEVRPGDAASAAADIAPYLAATRAAALQWRFNPLQINHWSADANGESHVVDSRTEPFSLDYVFRFTCRAGRAQVTAGDKVAPG